MNEAPKVSVIVPIYNNQKYLHQCIDSILAQTLREIEIILVDDGSTDNCPQICDEYAARDSRVRVIHQPNGGSGVAFNTGMDAAQGAYIGFVESDDWIEPQMYEKLYEKAVKYDVDVVKSLFTEVCDGKPNKLMNKFGKLQFFYQRVDNVTDIPAFCYGHPSHWSAIYRKQLIVEKSIRFHTSPGAASQDIGFNLQVFEKMKSLYVLPMSFYNYRLDNPNSSGAQRNKLAANVLREWNWIRDSHNSAEKNPAYREIEARSMFSSLFWNYSTKCARTQKWRYIIKVSELCRKYLPEISFKNFTNRERKLFKAIAKHPRLYFIKSCLYDSKRIPGLKRIKVLGINIKETKTLPDKKIKYILGVPLIKQKRSAKEIKHYILGLPYKTILSREKKKKHYFLGIKYKTSTAPVKTSPADLDLRMFRMAAYANAIADTHRQTFPKYKASNQGKDVMLIACGPTAKYAPLLDGVKHLAVNRAITLPQFKFDYCFMMDYWAVREYIDVTFDYGCINFFGKYIYDNCQKISIPDWVAEKAHAERYFTEGPNATRVYHDIEWFPLADFWSITHCALHFLLYTRPRRIYLVGCDTDNSGYFDKNVLSTLIVKPLKKGYSKLKELRDIFYPEVEIISINPVGLKNMFKDMYTQSYLKDHPEIKVSDDQIIDKTTI